MSSASFFKSGLLAMAFVTVSNAAAGNVCPHIDKCVSQHNPSYATSYCSSYLGITTSTTTVSGSTTTETATTTTYTATTTVLSPSLESNCGNGNDKRAIAAKTHSKPFCLRHFTQSSGISKGCECLDIPTPTTTATAAEQTVTSTTTISAVSTAEASMFVLYDESNGNPGQTSASDGSILAFYGDNINPVTLDNQCQLYYLGFNFYVQSGGGEVKVYSPGDQPSGYNIVTCYLDGENLSCSTSDGSDLNVPGPLNTWQLEQEAPSGDTFAIQASPIIVGNN